MSAFGFVVGKDKTVIASDGFLWSPSGVESLDTRKVFLPSDHTAILWLGCGAQALSDQVLKDCKKKKAKTPEAVANLLSKHLEHGFDHPEGQKILKEHQFWILILGYNPDPEMYLFFSDAKEGPYEPVAMPVNVGDCGCRAYDLNPKETNFKALYKLKYYPLYRDQEKATEAAFTEMVRAYEKTKDVGGEIFIDTITRPKMSAIVPEQSLNEKNPV